jgi:hypothetical protein
MEKETKFNRVQKIEQKRFSAIEIHTFYGFAILAQESNDEINKNEVILIDINSIDVLLKKLEKIKQEQFN